MTWEYVIGAIIISIAFQWLFLVVLSKTLDDLEKRVKEVVKKRE